MSIIRATFDWAGEYYARVFADWLHIHFLIRTVLLLLVLWLLIFIASKFFQYAAGPLLVMFWRHVLLRSWNYLFVESFQEWLYIKYYSKDKPNFNALYLRLCDKVKRNRQKIMYTTYSGILHRGKVRRAALQGMAAFGTIAALWVVPFGLHQQYYAPAVAIVDAAEYFDDYEYGGYHEEYELLETAPPLHAHHYISDQWQENTIFTLNEQGRPGARLWSGPGIDEHTIVEILWDYDQLLYLNAAVPDVDVMGMYWLFVQTPSGASGYISSQLVQ